MNIPEKRSFMPKRKKYPKLRGSTRELASKYIAEEFRTGKYRPSQAKAIGISRARAEARKSTSSSKLKTILSRY
jgi:hypothetical protein